MIWKDFFFFSGSQRSGIVILFVLIVISFSINKLLPVLIPDEIPEVDGVAFIDEVNRFQRSLYATDSIKNAKRFVRKWPSQYSNVVRTDKEEGVLFPFDPNTLDSTGLRQLGIPARVVSGILRYRRKGGVFYTPERFAEVYGLSPDLFQLLKPYIIIDLPRITEVHPDDLKQKPDMPLQINTVDSASLMQLKGLNKNLVRSFLRFRNASGGFVSVDQLRELYGMTDEVFLKINSYFVVDTVAVRKIRVNTAGVDKLKAHPYLNFYQAKAIYEYRRKKGKVKSIDELLKIEELDPNTLQKMEHYFSFE